MSETETEQKRVAKINITLSDKIGLGPPSYSKVEVGASVTREVVDEGPEAILEELNTLAKEVVEPFIASERSKVLKWLQDSGEKNA